MKCKGQLTLTLVLSVIIIGVFIFAFYATGKLVLNKVDVSQQRQQAGQEAVKPINDYITQCLDQTARTGLENLGRQAGRLYASEGGTFSDPGAGTDFINHSGQVIPYGITSAEGFALGNFFISGPSNFDPYPWPTYPVDDTGTTRFDGLYGLTSLPSLEGPLSTGEALEAFIENGLITCLDWSLFENRGTEVAAGVPDVRVTFAAEDTRVELSYPVNVSNAISGVQATFDSFQVSYPIRLQEIYNFSHTVVLFDVTDISFDLGAAIRFIPGRGAMNMSVRIERGVEADIIYIRDPLSKIFSEDYVFRFARENRQPALRFIDPIDSSISVCEGSNVSMIPGGFRVTTCDTVIDRNVTGDDPDEDILNFSVLRLADSQETVFPLVLGPVGSQDRFNFNKINITVSDGDMMDRQILSPEGFNS